jgi:hypothetical protein
VSDGRRRPRWPPLHRCGARRRRPSPTRVRRTAPPPPPRTIRCSMRPAALPRRRTPGCPWRSPAGCAPAGGARRGTRPRSVASDAAGGQALQHHAPRSGSGRTGCLRRHASSKFLRSRCCTGHCQETHVRSQLDSCHVLDGVPDDGPVDGRYPDHEFGRRSGRALPGARNPRTLLGRQPRTLGHRRCAGAGTTRTLVARPARASQAARLRRTEGVASTPAAAPRTTIFFTELSSRTGWAKPAVEVPGPPAARDQ